MFYLTLVQHLKQKSENEIVEKILATKKLATCGEPPRFYLLTPTQKLEKVEFTFQMLLNRWVCILVKKKLNFTKSCGRKFCLLR